MSAGTARDLLSPLSSGVSSIIAADANADKLESLKKSLNDSRLKTRLLDVNDRAALLALLQECDLCINGVPTFAGFQMAIFDACLQAKRPYADYGGMGVYTVKQKSEHEKWKAAGATAVIGLGSDPGMSNILCRAVADRLDTIERINLYWGATKTGPDSPVLVPPYSISTVLAEYANPSQQFLNGKLQEVPPQAGAETIELPQPWGRTTFIHSQHSEPLTVPFSEGIKQKAIREFTWKLSLPERDHEAWVGLVKAGFDAENEAITVKGVTVRPLDVLQAVIERNIKKNATRIPSQEVHEIHFAIGHGVREGKPCKVTCRVIGRPDPLYGDYADAGTSMNMSIGVQQMLSKPMKPGVWAAEEYFEVGEFFRELRKRHFEIEIETQVLEVASKC